MWCKYFSRIINSLISLIVVFGIFSFSCLIPISFISSIFFLVIFHNFNSSLILFDFQNLFFFFAANFNFLSNASKPSIFIISNFLTLFVVISSIYYISSFLIISVFSISSSIFFKTVGVSLNLLIIILSNPFFIQLYVF